MTEKQDLLIILFEREIIYLKNGSIFGDITSQNYIQTRFQHWETLHGKSCIVQKE